MEEIRRTDDIEIVPVQAKILKMMHSEGYVPQRPVRTNEPASQQRALDSKRKAQRQARKAARRQAAGRKHRR